MCNRVTYIISSLDLSQILCALVFRDGDGAKSHLNLLCCLCVYVLRENLFAGALIVAEPVCTCTGFVFN